MGRYCSLTGRDGTTTDSVPNRLLQFPDGSRIFNDVSGVATGFGLGLRQTPLQLTIRNGCITAKRGEKHHLAKRESCEIISFASPWYRCYVFRLYNIASKSKVVCCRTFILVRAFSIFGGIGVITFSCQS